MIERKMIEKLVVIVSMGTRAEFLHLDFEFFNVFVTEQTDLCKKKFVKRTSFTE